MTGVIVETLELLFNNRDRAADLLLVPYSCKEIDMKCQPRSQTFPCTLGRLSPSGHRALYNSCLEHLCVCKQIGVVHFSELHLHILMRPPH